MRLPVLALFIPIVVQSLDSSHPIPQPPFETPVLIGAQPASLPSQQGGPLPTPSEDLYAKKIMASMSSLGWAPISTIVPTESSSLASETALPSSSLQREEEAVFVIEDTPPHGTILQTKDAETSPEPHHIELRQNPGVGGGAPVAITQPLQVSPITTVFIGSVQVVYTQLFSAVPDQGPSPVAGSIGMGTLTGSVGVVKTQAAGNAGSGRNYAAWRSVWGIGTLGTIGAVVGARMI